jgi:hypothetical protein
MTRTIYWFKLETTPLPVSLFIAAGAYSMPTAAVTYFVVAAIYANRKPPISVDYDPDLVPCVRRDSRWAGDSAAATDRSRFLRPSRSQSQVISGHAMMCSV